MALPTVEEALAAKTPMQMIPRFWLFMCHESCLEDGMGWDSFRIAHSDYSTVVDALKSAEPGLVWQIVDIFCMGIVSRSEDLKQKKH